MRYNEIICVHTTKGSMINVILINQDDLVQLAKFHILQSDWKNLDKANMILKEELNKKGVTKYHIEYFKID